MAETGKKIRVAMLGYWCPAHADGYAQTILSGNLARICAVWDCDAARALPFAKRLNVPLYTDLAQLFSRHAIDGVILNAEPWTHAALAVEAVRRGKHVLADKIVAMGQEQRDMLRAQVRCARQRDQLVFAAAFPLIRRGYYQTARQMIRSGALGRIHMLRMREAHHQMARPGFAQALARDQRGVFVNTGFHTLYIMPYLLDEKPVSVTAVSQRASGLSCEDNGVSVLSFASGCLAVHETSYLSEQSPFSFGVYGDRGTLLMGGPQADLRVNTGGGWEPVPMLPALPLAEEDWLDAIARRCAPCVGLEEGLEKAAWLDCLYRSADEERTVWL
jgi:predicted dehydrogenase